MRWVCTKVFCNEVEQASNTAWYICAVGNVTSNHLLKENMFGQLGGLQLLASKAAWFLLSC